MNKIMQLNFAPADSGTGSVVGKEPLTKSSILDALNDTTDDAPADDTLDLDDTKDKKPELKTKEEVTEEIDETEELDEDEEVDELAELEEELKDPSEEDLELTTPVKKREILAKYPTIFKDFPSLEKAYYRELAYTKLLPTIDDAKEAVSAVQTLQSFENALKDGNTVDVLKAVFEEDKNAFAKIADNYMENLAQVDERAYHHVLGNITKDIVKAMVGAGNKNQNKELNDAATILYSFMFGDADWKPKQKLAIEEDTTVSTEKKSLQKEREDFETSKYTEAQSSLMTGVNNRLRSVIDSNIDKNSQMTPFIKKSAVKEVQDKLDSLIKADTRFQTIINQLWKKAKENKYSREYLDKIESAHVSKAKSLLMTVIPAVKKEVLKGVGTSRKIDKDTETNESETPRRQRTKVDSTIDTNKRKPGESSLDFLLRD